MDKLFLQQLLDTPSPSGFEQENAKLWRNHLKNYANISKDVHGNSYAILNPQAKFRFMLAGHIDEIGLMITYIDNDGFLSVAAIGGIDPVLLVGQRVNILTKKGSVFGVIGRKPIHLLDAKEKTAGVTIADIWIDIGAQNKKAAEKLVSVGDPLVIDAYYQQLNKERFVARGCDDRAGAFVVAEIIKKLSKCKLNICVIGVATVQEEVGLRGAITSTYKMQPQAGIAIDLNFATDFPNSNPKKTGDIKLGAGPMLHRGANINPVMGKGLFCLAKKLKIPYQISAEPQETGTDASAMQLSHGGIAANLISLPNRYMHTPVEMLAYSDLENTIKLIAEYLKTLPKNKDFRP